MSQSNSLLTCPVCRDNYIEGNKIPVAGELDVFMYKCKRCGQFIVSNTVLDNPHLESRRHLVSAWIRRQNKIGILYPRVGGDMGGSVDNWFQNLGHGFPGTVTERLDALLLAYADMAKDEIGKIIKIHLFPQLISDTAAKNIEEVNALSQLLHELEYISFNGTSLKIHANGWHRIDELHKSKYSTDSAFIAVWYDTCTEKYREVIMNAVKYCGYKPYIVDQHNFSGFIMDQIILLIRQSRFLIADFTCRAEKRDSSKQIINGVRGGVYWEAGFAYGMEKSVIHTCEDNEEAKSRIHFDLKQYNTIYWKPGELTDRLDVLNPSPNFAEKLASRILAVIGKGSYEGIS